MNMIATPEIKSIIDDCYAETKRILIEKQAIVEGLAQRLIKKLTVDGPDFDGHEVDFDELMRRNTFFREEEAHACRLEAKENG